MRKFNVTVNGKSYAVEVDEVGGSAPLASVASQPVAEAQSTPSEPTIDLGSGTQVVSPMPGLILNFAVDNGATVKKNDKILGLEAMKMEQDIVAPIDGIVTFAVKKGDKVKNGAVLAIIK